MSNPLNKYVHRDTCCWWKKKCIFITIFSIILFLVTTQYGSSLQKTIPYSLLLSFRIFPSLLTPWDHLIYKHFYILHGIHHYFFSWFLHSFIWLYFQGFYKNGRFVFSFKVSVISWTVCLSSWLNNVFSQWLSLIIATVDNSATFIQYPKGEPENQ